MRIAMADDRAEDQAELLENLEYYFAQRGIRAEYECFSSAEELLSAFAPGRFDLVFLDIYMGGITGMEAARQISREDPLCRLIFYTVSVEHAVESYAVRASYYLTKPVNPISVAQALDIACAALLRDNYAIEVSSRHVTAHILLRDILWADCADERLRLHLENRMIVLDQRASEVLPRLLEDPRFLSCNRNMAVNMDWIFRARDEDFLLKNQESVPIRQRGRSAVKKQFLSYSLRDLRKEETP